MVREALEALSQTLTQWPEIERLVIYGRDELKQWELQQLYPESTHNFVFLGDIRDQDRTRRALEG